MKINKMKKYKDKFVKQMLAQQIFASFELAEEVEKQYKKTLGKTLDQTQEGFKDAQLRVKTDIKTLKTKGVELKVRAFVAYKGSNQKHKIWHFINDGNSFKAKKGQIARIGDQQPRTSFKSFDFKPKNTSYKFRGLKEGSTYSWKGRKWYSKTKTHLILNISRKEYMKGWTTKITVKGES